MGYQLKLKGKLNFYSKGNSSVNCNKQAGERYSVSRGTDHSSLSWL